MTTFTALCTVPRKYIDVEADVQKDAHTTEAFGVDQTVSVYDSYLEQFSVDTLGFLHSPKYSSEEALELYFFERNSMNITFKFSCDADNTDDAGDWLEAKLPGDWHIDEILEAEQQGVAA